MGTSVLLVGGTVGVTGFLPSPPQRFLASGSMQSPDGGELARPLRVCAAAAAQHKTMSICRLGTYAQSCHLACMQAPDLQVVQCDREGQELSEKYQHMRMCSCWEE